MADEYRVEVELNDSEHGLSFWERLRALGVDEDAKKRLGGQVTVTRDGSRLLIYANTEEDAREAEKTVREVVTDDHLTADYKLSRWSHAKQEWTDPSVPEDEDAPEPSYEGVETPDRNYVVMQAYKPEFLRDLGL
ncbi:hypothetical protein EV644_14418 [Kribbella orskensis]|uniref:Uncharacterized protein n=1 Tax=Kribbella orskensis TaxID=2512216 RepID=A0ABY2B8I7_9ACTN|nr:MULTISPECIES: hypothetical protein [Kribbella]TCN28810.1 hypothetical protein EV642_14716 [Kribbella sp. VKM Ac-2500]TCO08622.1 hypothetical protein EV644_14418 [Kribbella orskensis]